MAVTQQLVRLSPALLAECRSSVEALDEVCSFKLSETGYLDLDWWPIYLEQVAEACAPSEFDVLGDVCVGKYEVNPAYRDLPIPTIWEHPVTAFEPADVRQRAEELTAVPLEHLPPWLAEQVVVLRDFYASAAERGMAIAFWWD